MEEINKKMIRKRILAARDALSKENIGEMSGRICERVVLLQAIRDCAVLMAFLSFGSEVETDAIIEWAWQQDKRVCVPRCRPGERRIDPHRIKSYDDLEPGSFGIREPKPEMATLQPIADIDAALVPAVAFDRRGYRVGYGGGYYDRFLPELPTQTIRVGLAFSCQLVEAIPAGAHDVPVDMIVTEKEVITTGSPR
ncbi:MAG: 5-formyltetrahydrofolate cyclo-ligase [Deltaproteobacteria bacterium]|nr:5-formyltetrahydrofolate cyclo-ligase [Deltaproteobacteria bacterium]